MKTSPRLLSLALALPLLLSPSALRAAGYSKAEVTRLQNEVKVLKENVNPRDAVVGDQIDSVTSVATGASSRAELKFPDNSLTRLGANSRFTLRGDSRTLDLDQGVMLLQVPKKLGGAKVRTAAVTAAVTGTTVMFEYLPGGYVKLIVIEGVVDLYFNNDPSKFSHITAGQMIIMKTDSKNLPTPVDIDLSLLLKTSKLISGDDKSMPNFMEVADALQQQQKELKKGDLVATSFVLPGRGTVVELSTNTRTNLFKNIGVRDGAPQQPGTGGNGGGQPGKPGTTPPNNGPAFTGYVPLITGTSYLGGGSLVETNPHVTVYNAITDSETRFAGALYNANPDTEANPGFTPFPYFAFGSTSPVENANFQDFLAGSYPVPSYGSYYYCPPDQRWAVFKFENLVVEGTPEFDFPISTFVVGETPVGNVIFSSVGDLDFYPLWGPDESFYHDTFDVSDYYDLDKVVFYSQQGNIYMDWDFRINGSDQDFAFVAAGLQSDVFLGGTLCTNGNVLISAGQDVILHNKLEARSLDVAAGRNIEINSGSESPTAKIKTKKGMEFRAGGSIKIEDSTSLKVLSSNPDAVMKLLAKGGDIHIGSADGNYYTTTTLKAPNIEIEAVNGNGLRGDININWSNITATHVLQARTVGPDGWINIGNSNLKADAALNLYATGTNGGISFTGNNTLTSENSVHLKGRTVRVDAAGSVNINMGATGSARVDTDNAQFNKAGYGPINVNGGPSLDRRDFAGNPLPH